jgi:tRNA (uracil-5-)-methyltransferase TRM9
MVRKAEIRATYDRIADSFAAPRREPWPEARSFIETLPQGSRVVDLGSGHGRHARALAERGCRSVAFDFSLRLLMIGRTAERTKRTRPSIDWVEGEATQLPFRDRAFDAALCIAVLHHLPTEADRIAALREVQRVIRPRSPVFASVWARDQPRFRGSLSTQASGDVEVPWTMPDGVVVPRFYHLFWDGELERLIIESGLHGERFFRGDGNWFVLARRHG